MVEILIILCAFFTHLIIYIIINLLWIELIVKIILITLGTIYLCRNFKS